MKLLVTGGCGFVGSNIVAAALERGDEVAVFDNLFRVGGQSNLDWLKSLGQFGFVHGDIRKWNDVARVIRDFQPDAIAHLAGQVAMTTSLANPRMDFEVNAVGSHNVLESTRLHCPDAIVIYASTNKVYGDLEQYRYDESSTRYKCLDRPHGFDETVGLSFHSPYGCSKGAADQYMIDYARVFGLKTIVFRHSTIYGGRQRATVDQGWIGWFCQQAIEFKAGRVSTALNVAGNGKQVRDLLHVTDVVRLYFEAMQAGPHIWGKAFNVGGGFANSLSIIELFKLLGQELGIDIPMNSLQARLGDQRVFIADTAALTRQLGWTPKVEYVEGIREVIAFERDRIAK
jgi:CDP-paratose 2-epimerase